MIELKGAGKEIAGFRYVRMFSDCYVSHTTLEVAFDIYVKEFCDTTTMVVCAADRFSFALGAVKESGKGLCVLPLLIENRWFLCGTSGCVWAVDP